MPYQNRLVDFGITKCSYFAIFEIYWIHAHFIYVETDNNAFFIPLVGYDDEKPLGLEEMKIYEKNDEIIQALGLRLKANIELIDPPIGFIDYKTPFVFIDKQYINFDVNPIIENNRVLVPLRKIAEFLTAKVDWDDETKTISLIKDNNVKLKIGDSLAYKNNIPFKLDVPARIVDNRTLVSIGFIREAFGVIINYDDNANIVIIKTK